jgi:hypothetical protein
MVGREEKEEKGKEGKVLGGWREREGEYIIEVKCVPRKEEENDSRTVRIYV